MVKMYTDLPLHQNGLKTSYLGAPYTSISYLLPALLLNYYADQALTS